MKWLCRSLLLFGVLTACQAFAQSPCPPESGEFPAANSCPTSGSAWNTSNTPFVDADCTHGCPAYNDPPYNDVISLYGTYGNSEGSGLALTHAQTGVNLGSSITPLCADHSSPPSCANGKAPAIVMVVAGFSNCEIEVCGGIEDIWQNPPATLGTLTPSFPGQPCATYYQGCPNLNAGNPLQVPYNAYASNDGQLQQSFLQQVYSPTPHLVGSHVVIFNAAVGDQSLDRWDPYGYPTGGFMTHPCNVPGLQHWDAVCNWDATAQALTNNQYDPWQVQVLYLKASLALPQCSLKNQSLYCTPASLGTPNAVLEEQALGNILRYLKLGATVNVNGVNTHYPAPYPNLKQVFLSTRIYGGYANGTAHGCLSPEPYAYEEAFAVQRLIVAQINGAPDSNSASGAVDLSSAPWFDWGPYLWADGATPRHSDLLVWCNGQPTGFCANQSDVRFGDRNDQTTYWGDFTHPTAQGAKKVADQMVTFFTKGVTSGGSQFVQGWRQQ